VAAVDPYGAEASREPAAMQISRSGSTGSPLTVRLSMSGTAANGTDYESVASSLVIPAGSASAVVVIRPIDDATGEGSESVTLTLTANGAYKIGASSSVTGFLADNDAGAPPPEQPTRRVKTVWVDDTLPNGAIRYGEGGDRWTWVDAPAFSGKTAHRSNTAHGHHQHFFNYAKRTMPVRSGDVLFAHVYIDPVNPPEQIMLQWNDGTWEHRAYWGRSMNDLGVENTASRRAMGPLPKAGRWVRLEVPANLVGLEGKNLKGMAFTLYGGRATWDQAGKFTWR
jgi:hypothetical protein